MILRSLLGGPFVGIFLCLMPPTQLTAMAMHQHGSYTRLALQVVRGMAGHSKWRTIKHDKMEADAARNRSFLKISREIMSCVRANGPDPAENIRLSSAIARGRKIDMPLSRIESAIKAALDRGEDAEKAEQVFYEGRGPAGVAVMVQVLTDNRRRAHQDVKNVFTHTPGAVFSSGGGDVAWLFERKGIVTLEGTPDLPLPTGEGLVELALALDAEDVKEDGADDDAFGSGAGGAAARTRTRTRTVDVVCDPALVGSVHRAAMQRGFKVPSAAIEYVPKEHVTLAGEDAVEAYRDFEERLQDLGDVMRIYSNAVVEGDG
eukprot:Opistho-2@12376